MMNNTQEEKLSMYLAVQQYLNSDPTAWNGLPIAVNLVGELNALITNIQNTARQKQTIHYNTGKIKKEKAKIMAERGIAVAKIIQAYASVNEDRQLANDIYYTLTDITKARDNDAKVFVEVIFNKGQEMANDLADYGLTPAMLTNLDTAITEFGAIMSMPIANRDSRKQVNSQLKDLIAAADDLLKNKLDRLFVQYKGSPFHQMYQDARKMNK